jgi:hypothetical protein
MNIADMMRWRHQQKLAITVLDDAKQAEDIVNKAEEITRPGAYMIPSWAIIKVLREKSAAK